MVTNYCQLQKRGSTLRTLWLNLVAQCQQFIDQSAQVRFGSRNEARFLICRNIESPHQDRSLKCICDSDARDTLRNLARYFKVPQATYQSTSWLSGNRLVKSVDLGLMDCGSFKKQASQRFRVLSKIGIQPKRSFIVKNFSQGGSSGLWNFYELREGVMDNGCFSFPTVIESRLSYARMFSDLRHCQGVPAVFAIKLDCSLQKTLIDRRITWTADTLIGALSHHCLHRIDKANPTQNPDS